MGPSNPDGVLQEEERTGNKKDARERFPEGSGPADVCLGLLASGTVRKCSPVPLCGTLLWECWPGDTAWVWGRPGQQVSSCHGREWTCLRQGMERQEEAPENGCFSKPGQAMTGGLLRAAPHVRPTPTVLSPKSPLSLSGCSVHTCTALCEVWEGHVNGGRRKLDSLSAGTCCERGRLDQELKPGRPHQAEW